jgi:hypothetical protein
VAGGGPRYSSSSPPSSRNFRKAATWTID